MLAKHTRMKSIPPSLAHLNTPMQYIKYRHIKEGRGGVFPRSSSISDLIGTYNCITCVGVYFPISDTHCFVAHINACIRPQNYGPQQLREDPLPRDCKGGEGEQVKGKVLEKLRKAAADHHFDPLNVHLAEFILICPKYNGQPMTGKIRRRSDRGVLRRWQATSRSGLSRLRAKYCYTGIYVEIVG